MACSCKKKKIKVATKDIKQVLKTTTNGGATKQTKPRR